MSISYIYNQTVTGTGLDPVTFPDMGPLRGKYVSETTKNSDFVIESNFKYFFLYLSLLFS